MSEATPSRFEPIAVSSESTVVAEFVADPASSASYQSEADLEREFIRLLESQAYERLVITSEEQLTAKHVIVLQTHGLLFDALVGARDALGKELLPLGVRELDPIQSFELCS